MGNMGILEWLIMLVILFIFFGVPLMLVLMMMYQRRSEERGMNAQDRMTMQRIMAALEQMEQRVEKHGNHPDAARRASGFGPGVKVLNCHEERSFIQWYLPLRLLPSF